MKASAVPGMASRLRVTADPLDLNVMAALVASPGHGGVVHFVGVVRHDNAGRRVLWLEYEAYGPLALKAFERIDRESAGHWPGVVLAIHHRTGRLEIGEASVMIATASAHRAEAYAASRYAIERVKQIAPIWKREYFEGGDVWIEGAVADADDEAARQIAFERACS